jgi:hypothetical protein
VDVGRLDQTNSKNGKHTPPLQEQRTASPRAVLEELFLLLEDYAPVWYTQEHHDRAVAALLSPDNQSR